MSVVISFCRKGWGICLVVVFVQVPVYSVDGKDEFLYNSRPSRQHVVLVDWKQQSMVVQKEGQEVQGG